MVKLQSFTNSSNPDKKYMVVLIKPDGKTKTIHFGANGMDDFTKTGDIEQKSRYIKRHQAREDWTNPLTAGFWSKNILWNKSTIKASLADTKSRFNL